ncbi:tetratricopeptide repeat protein [Pelagibacteraceae bacterium]|nr:tetratricopeptide repeat protein [Pelagibacteraceae bacterium]
MTKNNNFDQRILNIINLFNKNEYDEVIKFATDLSKKNNTISIFPNLIGASYARKNYHEQAIYYFEKAIKIEPSNFELYNNIGKSLFKLKHYDKSAKAFNKSIELNQENADSYFSLALVYKEQNKIDESINLLENSIKINPLFFQAFYNLGLIFHERRDCNLAILNYKKAISINSKYIKAYNNIGIIYIYIKDYENAKNYLNKALEIEPNYPEAINNLGIVEMDQKNFISALNYFNQVLAIDRNQLQSLAQKLFIERKICDWSNFEKHLDLLKLINKSSDTVTPWQLLAIDDNPKDELLRAQKYAKQFNKKLINITQIKKDKIKIGYFTPDFYEHAGMMNMEAIFKHHDKNKFEICGFDYGLKNNDETHQRIKTYFDEFYYVSSLSDKEIANLSKKNNIDIAIHRNGYSQNSRNNIFAYRAAPSQISFLGYPGTTSLNFIDYIVADKVVIPEQNIKFFSENIIFMPNSYYPTNNKRLISSKIFSRSDYNIPNDAFVFCSFNNSYKISPIEFNIWMEILSETTNTYLILLINQEEAKQNLINQIKKSNIDLNRIKFFNFITNSEHLSRHKIADLYLDTFNYNGHTSIVDALLSGLPVITKIGDSFTARVGASLIEAFNMKSLVTTSIKDYKELAIKISEDKILYKNLKKKVDENINSSALFDNEKYVKNLEKAYENIYLNKLKNRSLKNLII